MRQKTTECLENPHTLFKSSGNTTFNSRMTGKKTKTVNERVTQIKCHKKSIERENNTNSFKNNTLQENWMFSRRSKPPRSIELILFCSVFFFSNSHVFFVYLIYRDSLTSLTNLDHSIGFVNLPQKETRNYRLNWSQYLRLIEIGNRAEKLKSLSFHFRLLWIRVIKTEFSFRIFSYYYLFILSFHCVYFGRCGHERSKCKSNNNWR